MGYPHQWFFNPHFALLSQGQGKGAHVTHYGPRAALGATAGHCPLAVVAVVEQYLVALQPHGQSERAEWGQAGAQDLRGHLH